MDFIPYSKPFLPAFTADALCSAVASGSLSGNGQYSKRVSKQLQDITHSRFAMLTTSCSHALELACAILADNIRESGHNEVIVPSFAFSSCANAILNAGLFPVFADIEPDTLNISPEDVLKKITSKTAAIMPIHYAGIAADMESLCSIAKDEIMIIEDAAQGIGAYWNDSPLGSIGDMGCISFHETKNITCGEGGAFLTSNKKFAEKAEVYIEKGTNRSQFICGMADKYTWVSKGSSYVLAEPLAALLEIGLPFTDEIVKQRQTLFMRYLRAFEELAIENRVRLPHIPEYAKSNAHIFYLVLPDNSERDMLMNYLRLKNIDVRFHYIPLHSSPMGISLGFQPNDCPVAEEYSERLLRLPLYPQMSDNQQEYIIETTNNYFLQDAHAPLCAKLQTKR